MNSTRVTARIVRTEDGETYHEYEVGGVAIRLAGRCESRARCSLSFKSERFMKLIHQYD